MYTDNEILFPNTAIASLKKLRGAEWESLVEQIAALPENHEDTLSFMLMMIRLNGCMSCETDSYRAMRGCTACAHQTLRRYKGTDDDLIKLFEKARKDLREFKERTPHIEVLLTT